MSTTTFLVGLVASATLGAGAAAGAGIVDNPLATSADTETHIDVDTGFDTELDSRIEQESPSVVDAANGAARTEAGVGARIDASAELEGQVDDAVTMVVEPFDHIAPSRQFAGDAQADGEATTRSGGASTQTETSTRSESEVDAGAGSLTAETEIEATAGLSATVGG